MSLIEWREEYCTGIKGVDYEHEQLIAQINSVFELIASQGDRSQVVDALGEIYGRISTHFALEEQTMLRHHYDHYKQHKADHEVLLDQIRISLTNTKRLFCWMRRISNKNWLTGS